MLEQKPIMPARQVRAAVLTGFAEVARFVGLDPFEQLSRAGIRPEQLATPGTWLSAKPVAELLDRCALESQRSDFAILLAECRSFSSLGPLTLLLKHEASLRRIIDRMGQYKRHLNDIFDLHLEELDEVAILRWTVLPDYSSPQVVALVSATGYRALTRAMSGSWTPASVHFPFERPPAFAAFHRYFDCPVDFGSSFSGLSFPRSDLDRPNPLADPDMALHAEALLSLVQRPSDEFADRVSHALMLLLPSGRASLAGIAHNLGLPRRSVQRTLDRNGLSFARLLTDVRRRLAVHYLSHPDRSISETASLTGYSSVSAFSRWFTDQFGQSPRSWRGDHQF